MEVTKKILNKFGVHARPAAAFAEEVIKSKSRVTVTNLRNNKSCDGSDILGIMGLELQFDDSVVICAEGCDEADTIRRLSSLIDDKLVFTSQR